MGIFARHQRRGDVYGLIAAACRTAALELDLNTAWDARWLVCPVINRVLDRRIGAEVLLHGTQNVWMRHVAGRCGRSRRVYSASGIALAGKTTVPLGGCLHQFGYLLTPISESMSLSGCSMSSAVH